MVYNIGMFIFCNNVYDNEVVATEESEDLGENYISSSAIAYIIAALSLIGVIFMVIFIFIYIDHSNKLFLFMYTMMFLVLAVISLDILVCTVEIINFDILDTILYMSPLILTVVVNYLDRKLDGTWSNISSLVMFVAYLSLCIYHFNRDVSVIYSHKPMMSRIQLVISIFLALIWIVFSRYVFMWCYRFCKCYEEIKKNGTIKISVIILPLSFLLYVFYTIIFFNIMYKDIIRKDINLNLLDILLYILPFFVLFCFIVYYDAQAEVGKEIPENLRIVVYVFALLFGFLLLLYHFEFFSNKNQSEYSKYDHNLDSYEGLNSVLSDDHKHQKSVDDEVYDN